MIRLGSGSRPVAIRSRLQRQRGVAALAPQPRPAAIAALRGEEEAKLGWPALLLVLAATTYNTQLALANASGAYIGLPAVMLTEFLVLTLALAVVVGAGLRPIDWPAILFFGFFLVTATLVSLLSETVYIDMVRNVAIITFFLMLGARTTETALLRAFRIAAILVFAFLLLEIFSVDSYASIFKPAAYFQQTRGIVPREFDEGGLFSNALGFEGRFAILQITGHRTSSIFLEQVSLGNFAVILAIFLTTLWSRLGMLERMSHLCLIVLILVTNNSRAALGLVLMAPLVYIFAPKLNRHLVLMLLPVALIAAWIVVGSEPPTKEDTLIGRLGLTVRTLSTLDLPTMFGSKALLAANFADVGYAYVICTSTIIGAIALWLFVSLIVPGHTAAGKRLSFLAALYVFSTLLVSGTSAFSIKTAALLWLLIGFVRSAEAPAVSTQLSGSDSLEFVPLPGVARQTSALSSDGRPLRTFATRPPAA